jgi:serine/threonine-protein kinase
MHEAHRHGIVHRDLKPANILLDANDQPHITDFGLAKLLNESSAQTQSGAIMGTPSYMAPEQAQGKQKAISAVTDVYALGAVLYELLTGRPPFLARTALDTVMLVVSNEPESPRRIRASIPGDLETICLKWAWTWRMTYAASRWGSRFAPAGYRAGSGSANGPGGDPRWPFS